MITVQKALDYINVAHRGYFAFACEDGLVFRSESVWVDKEPCIQLGDDNGELYWSLDEKAVSFEMYDHDRVEEDFEVFPIIDGMVDLKAIRAHMGY